MVNRFIVQWDITICTRSSLLKMIMSPTMTVSFLSNNKSHKTHEEIRLLKRLQMTGSHGAHAAVNRPI